MDNLLVFLLSFTHVGFSLFEFSSLSSCVLGLGKVAVAV